MAKKKEVKKEEIKVNTKGNNALDMRLHLVEKDVDHLIENIIEIEKDLKKIELLCNRIAERMGM